MSYLISTHGSHGTTDTSACTSGWKTPVHSFVQMLTYAYMNAIRAPTFSNRSLTHERWPSKQAVISGVNPCLSGACGRRGWERNEWEEEDFWSLEGKQRLYIVTLLNSCFKKKKKSLLICRYQFSEGEMHRADVSLPVQWRFRDFLLLIIRVKASMSHCKLLTHVAFKVKSNVKDFCWIRPLPHLLKLQASRGHQG